LLHFKASRDQQRHAESLARLEERCRSGANIMEPLIDAVDNGVTLGEVSDLFRSAFGEYRDPGTF
jgi:methylmalonyl-CoA mutase N-terminal domain/subunit